MAHILDARTNNIGIQPLYIADRNEENTPRKQIQVYSYYGGEANIYGKDIYNSINIFQIRLKDKKLEIYLNNSKIGENNDFNVNSLSNDLYIGQRHSGTNNFKGNIYAIRIYDRALAENELKNNYTRDFKIFNKNLADYITDDSLLLHYNGLDRGNTNNVWKDISGNGNDGKLVGNGEGGTINNQQISESDTNYTWNDKYLYVNGNVGILSSKNVNLGDEFTAEITVKSSEAAYFLIEARNSSGNGYQPLFYRKNNVLEFYNKKPDGTQVDLIPNLGDLGNNINTLQVINKKVGSKYEVYVYINGNKTKLGEYNNTPYAADAPIQILKRYEATNSSRIFKGNVYSVRVYNRALSEQELDVNYKMDKMNFLAFNATVDSFSKNKLDINLSSTETGIVKYYYKTDSESTYSNYTTSDSITISATNLKDEVKGVSIYGETADGRKTRTTTIKLKTEDISGYNLIKNGSFENGSDNWTLSNIVVTNATAYSGSCSLQFNTGGTAMSTQTLSQNSPTLNHTYYGALMFKSSSTFSTTDNRFEWFYTDGNGKHLIFANKSKTNNEWKKLSSVQTQTISDYLTKSWYVRNFLVNPTEVSYVDDLVVIDLTQLNTDKSYLKIQNNATWCDYFIKSEAGTTKIYYYQ